MASRFKRGTKSSETTKPTVSAEEASLIGKIATLSLDAKEQAAKLLGMTASSGPGGETRPGYTYDPKSGKTFKVRLAKKHSIVRSQAERLVTTSLQAMQAFLKKEELVFDKDKKTVVTAKGGSASAAAVATYKKLYEDLRHARAQLRIVKESEKPKTLASSKLLDPAKRPTLKKAADGKVNWVDDAGSVGAL